MNWLTTENLFTRLQAQFDNALPFVVYRKPQQDILQAFLQSDDVLYTVNDFGESGFVMAPFNGTPVLIPDVAAQKFCAQQSLTRTFSSVAFTEQDLESARIEHEQKVQRAVDVLQSGALNKVVLSRPEQLRVDDFDWSSVFEQMIRLYPDAFGYCFYHPRVGMWLGAFSEQLVHFSDHQVKTMAVAGTQKTPQEAPVFWGEKERREQQWVTDFIVSGMQKYVTQLRVSEPYTIQAGHLSHIRTDIQGILTDQAHRQKILSFLHPTPAVCGYPKQEALQYILAQEDYDRAYYAGFLGELNQAGQTDLFVNLRCMQILIRPDRRASEVILYVGGGLTAQSDPHQEWLETVQKALTMKKVLSE